MIPYREPILAVSMLAASAVQAAPRDTVPLTADWRFQLGDRPTAARAATFDDAGWSRVSLPHNWNRMGGTAERRADYQNVHGAGWYRRTFATPAKLGDRRAWIEIDAASIIADVWVNGVHLGRHAGAFARFRFDATVALKPAGDNVLVIRVDNSSPRDPGSPTAEVPPMNGDWPMYGGLYRGVSLVVTDPVRVAMRDFGGPGIYARTLTADATRAELSVTTRLENDRRRVAAVRVQATVLDATGRTVATAATPATIAATGSGATTRTIAVPTPHLWNGVADPYLYTLRVEIVGKDGRVLDRVEQPLGIRTFRIDPNTGFYLNGRALPLRGVSRHQDRPVKGWAIDAADIAEDMAIIRDIGANTLRLAHYQHADAAYAAADTAGLVTWAEIPLVDRSAPWASATTTPGFAANAERQLRELIRQTYNHPSIAVWSIANEVNLEAAKGRGTSNARPLLERLQRVVHEEDPSRPTTLADCCGSIPAEARAGLDTVAGITDVIGYNRYHGWYAGTGHFRDQPSASRGGQPDPVRPVAGTTDQVPYESWREGSFAYAIPVARGRYRVTLHLFEPVADKRPGQRVFTVAAEGKAMGKPIDVVREARGAMTALTRRFTVDVGDGMLDVRFTRQAGDALVSGIEVEPA